MQRSRPDPSIRFGPCRLDTGPGALVGSDGTKTLLRPKTLALLRFLLDNTGRIVSRDEIMDAVWPGVFVSDDSITQCVTELRKAMGAADLLRTVPRRGYLLETEVSGVDEAAPVVVAHIDDRPAVAVLPFRKESVDPEEAYFADGIIEGIIHVLSQMEWIFVISRDSTLAFAEITTDARAAARELGARYVLFGGVRRSGHRLRITTQLIDAIKGVVLNSSRYDGADADIFLLQDRIAEQVIATVMPRLRREETARALRKPPANLTAYDLVLQALDQIRRLTRPCMDEAKRLLELAVLADPTSALPLSYLAWWHSLRIAQGWGEADSEMEIAGRYADAALALDGRDVFALALRGFLRGYLDKDFEAARGAIDDVIAICPSSAIAWGWGGVVRSWLGDGRDAVTWAEQGLRLAPFDAFTFLHEHFLAQACYTLGDFERAIFCARRSQSVSPEHRPNLRTLIASLVAAGRLDEARDQAATLLALDPGFSLAGFAARTPLQGESRTLFIERLREASLPG